MHNAVAKLLDICRKQSCDLGAAETLLQGLDINERMICNSVSDGVTFLAEAVSSGNAAMTEFLLRYGADPNLSPDGEPLLCKLAFNDDEEVLSAHDMMRLDAAELLLKYGADPNCKLDENELLLDSVCYDVFNGDCRPLWEYQRKLLTLLILYGGKSQYCCLEHDQLFDLNDSHEYWLRLTPVYTGDRFRGYTGEMIKGNDQVVGRFR